MSSFKVTIHREDTQETIYPAFVSPVMPFIGLRVIHANKEWEITLVRLNIRDENSMAAKHDDPHLVDVFAREVDGMFR